MESSKTLDPQAQNELFAQINQQVESVSIEPPLTADKLADLVNALLKNSDPDERVSKWKIFRMQERGDVLFPKEKPGHKPRYEFTRDDLRTTLAIYRLRKYNLSIEECIEYTKNAFQIGLLRRTESPPGQKAIPDTTITGPIERARRYVWTRSLQYVLSLFFGTVPERTVIVIDRLEHQPAEGVVSISDIEPAWDSYSRSPNRVVSEIQQGIPFLGLTIDVTKENYQPIPTVLLAGDNSSADNYSYRIKIIWPHQGKQSFNQRGLWILTEKPARLVDCLLRLLALLFEKFEMPAQPSTLHAMATAITQIIPEIDVCGILLPVDDGASGLQLTVRATSENLVPTDLPQRLLPGGMLLAWVYEHGVALYIDDLEEDDWRVPDLNETEWTALAAIPVIEEPYHQIVFVARRRKLTEPNIFTQLNRDLLSVLAGIVSVVNEAERSDDDNLHRRTEQLFTEPLKRESFTDALLAASNTFFDTPASVRLTDRRAAVTLAFSIANISDIDKHCGGSYVAWLEERILEILSIQKTNLPGEQLTFCRTSSGQYVVVIEQTEHTEDIFKKMSKEVTLLLKSFYFRRAGKIFDVQAYSWVLYFPYSYLQRKVSPWKNDQFINLLEDRTERALLNLARFETMSEKLRIGDFSGAEAICRKAIDIDPENPNLHKYLGEALFYQQKYSEAEKALEDALNRDSQLPGAHVLRAQTLTALDKNPEGLKEYQTALEIKVTPRYLALYGEELLQQRQFTAAIEQFNRAKELDSKHATQYDMKIGEAYLGEGHPREAFNLFAALREIPEYYVLIEGHLRQARQGISEVIPELADPAIVQGRKQTQQTRDDNNTPRVRKRS